MEALKKIMASVFIPLGVITLVPFMVEYFFYEEKTNKLIKIHETSLVFSTIMLVSATIGLIGVAWIQLKNLSKNTKGEGIIEFDKKWGSNEIIKARKIIHDFYLEAQENEDIDKNGYIGKKIVALSYNKKRTDDFIHVLSFLNFFETISFLCKDSYLDSENIDELVGNSVKFYFQVFKPYIDHRRSKHDDESFHTEFEWLYHKARGDCKKICC